MFLFRYETLMKTEYFLFWVIWWRST